MALSMNDEQFEELAAWAEAQSDNVSNLSGGDLGILQETVVCLREEVEARRQFAEEEAGNEVGSVDRYLAKSVDCSVGDLL